MMDLILIFSIVGLLINTIIIVKKQKKLKICFYNERKSKEDYKWLFIETSKKMDALFNMCNDAILVLNKRFEVIELNPSFLYMVNRSYEKIIGKDLSLFFKDNSNLVKSICNPNSKENVRKCETLIYNNLDFKIPVQVCASVIRFKNKYFFFLVLNNITPTAQLRKEFLKNCIKLNEVNLNASPMN